MVLQDNYISSTEMYRPVSGLLLMMDLYTSNKHLSTEEHPVLMNTQLVTEDCHNVRVLKYSSFKEKLELYFVISVLCVLIIG
jgi:hypothetical protein